MDTGLHRTLSKSSSAVPTRDVFTSPPDRNSSRSGTPVHSDFTMDQSSRSLRPPPRPLFGENTLPSSTVLAMQNMQLRDYDGTLGDITNSSTRSPQGFDSIYSQMQNLTMIATTLQKEMTALSRRSKDNATDLVSLREATNSRDEDIRKSLREIVNSVRTSDANHLQFPRVEAPRSSSAMAYLDTQPFSTPPQSRSITLPKIPSVHSFDLSPESQRNPSPQYALDTTVGVAMLEKIIRDMATKEGQERVLSQLSTALINASRDAAEMGYKVGQVLEIVKDNSSSQALVRHPEQRNLSRRNSHHAEEMTRTRSNRSDGHPLESAIVNGEFLKILQNVKDSVTQSGGMTGEVKSLLKDLRGEVLGMGRELGRKLDKAEPTGNTATQPEENLSKDDVAQIISEGLAELREQMNMVIQAKRRQSNSSALSRSAIDSQEVYNAIRNALAEQGYDQSQALQTRRPDFDREAILAAVKEAYEAYKPEIELQQFGLERDEVLQCLKEGLVDYQSSKADTEPKRVDREEVMTAVHEAMQSFNPPRPSTEAAELKEEILLAVKESLEQFVPLSRELPPTQSSDITREDILEAVREGLATSIQAQGADITRDNVYEAVKAGLGGVQPFGNQSLDSFERIVQELQVQIRQLSASTEHSTDQVLATIQNGLTNLRTDVETYVDRSQDVTGREEIIQTIKDNVDSLRSQVGAVATQHNPPDYSPNMLEVLDCMKEEFENLHQTINSRPLNSTNDQSQKEELLLALTAGFTELQAGVNNRGRDQLADDNQEMLKSEFDQLHESIIENATTQKGEILGAIQDGVAAIHTRLVNVQNSSASTDEIIAAMKEEINSISDSLLAPMVQHGSSNNTEDVLEAVRSSVDGIRAQISSEQSEANNETLGLIREELEQLRHSLARAVTPVNSPLEKAEILEAIRVGIEDVRTQSENNTSGPDHVNALDGVREELEHLRQTLTSTLVKSGARLDTDEVLDAVRVGLDDLRVCIEKKVERPQSPAARSDEMLGTLNEILDSLRVDFANLADRQADTTLSSEILDTLKDGLAELRSEIDQLKTVNEKVRDEALVLANVSVDREENAQDPDDGLSRKSDLQKLEVQLAQLHIKVEALGLDIRTTLQPESPSEPTASKADIDSIDVLLRELQGTIAVLITAKPSIPDNVASKEDTDAIETLMQNTKAKIDDTIVPALDAVATKEDLDAVEVLVRMTNDSIESLSGLTALLQEAKTRTETGGIVTKADIDDVAESCRDILEKLADLPSTAPSKTDIEQLTELLQDFRQSHESQKERYEKDIGVTAKAFDDRKEEFKVITEQLEEMKTAIEESKNELNAKVKGGNQELKTLDKMLQGLEQKIDASPSPIPDVKELKDLVRKEFEEAQARLAVLKSEQEHASTAILEKQEELRSIVFAEILNRLDDRLDSITAKFEGQASATENIAREMAEKAAGHEDVLDRSQAMMEELKLTIDTFGATVTGITPALVEATEKMTEDSKTVYSRVEDIHTKLEEDGLDNKTEHQLTRNEVLKSLTTLDSLHESVSHFQPRFMETLVSLATMLEKHFDNAKQAEENLSDHVKGVKDHLLSLNSLQSDIPMLQANTASAQDDGLHKKIDELLAWGIPSSLDASAIHKKLDELSVSQGPPDVTIDLDGIEEIQQQITTSAGEISAFIQFQTKLLTVQHENKEKEAQAAAVEVARYNAEKNSLELAVTDLQDVKHSLKSDVASLHSEKDMLTAQKSRLAAEVSSLETALTIRREELQMMDARADALERRIIDSVMDHSKVLLTTKATRSPANMNLKRVPSNTSGATFVPTGVASTGIDMALKSQLALRRNPAVSSQPGRRILSLGQITSNVPKGGSALSVAPSRKAFASQMKRSQSVKQVSPRKNSWTDRESLAEYDKENDNDTDGSDVEIDSRDALSSTGYASRPTTRSQLSRSGTSTADRHSSYGTGESDYTYTTGSYLTGSELSKRTTSFGSTVRSVLGTRSSLAGDLDESEGQHSNSASDYEEDQRESGAVVQTKPVLLGAPHENEAISPVPEKYLLGLDGANDREEEQQHDRDVIIHRPGYDSGLGPETQVQLTEDLKHDVAKSYEKDMRREGYDSGLGSDLPTAALSSLSGNDYFIEK